MMQIGGVFQKMKLKKQIKEMYYFSILEMMVSIKSLLNMMLMNLPGRYF